MGTHDFAGFAQAKHGRESTVRTVHACDVTESPREEGGQHLAIDVSGDGFLYNMVRIIAGTLLEVGRGRIDPDRVRAALETGDRRLAGPTLPPEGLCLMWMRYLRRTDETHEQSRQDRRVRILHISTRLIVGGSQENTVLSCEEQTRRGHDVHLAFGPIYGPEGSMLDRVKAFEHEGRGITTHEIRDMIREVRPLRDLKATKQLRALIRELKPDIVHTHSSKAGVIGRAAAWKEDGRAGDMGVVHTVHGPSFHRFLPWWKNTMYVLAERYGAKRCHQVVSVADAMTAQYVGAGIGTPALYTTVRSGMETERSSAPTNRGEVRADLGFSDRTSCWAPSLASRSTRGTTTCSTRWDRSMRRARRSSSCGWATGGGATGCWRVPRRWAYASGSSRRARPARGRREAHRGDGRTDPSQLPGGAARERSCRRCWRACP